MQSAGLLVLVLHDMSDIALHTAKLFKYNNYNKITDFTFLIFMVIFFITRLVLLPVTAYSGSQWFYPHDSTSWQATALVNGLWLFVCLHCYWFTLIVKIAVKAVRQGNVEGDIRENNNNNDENYETSTARQVGNDAKYKLTNGHSHANGKKKD